MRTTRVVVALCAAAVSIGQSVAAMREGALEIWVGKGNANIQILAQRFTVETGIDVTVNNPADAPGLFQTAAAAGNGPDIMVWAHDRFGDWAHAGIIKPITPSPAFIAATLPEALDASTVDGSLYAYPIAIETISLIYNKALIDAPPASFEALFALDAQLEQSKGIKAIAWDVKNTYFTWPLMAASGAYPFKKTANGYDTSATDVNSDGAKYAAKLLTEMVSKGLLDKAMDYNIMNMMFHNQEVAMVLNGPWYWPELDKAGINYGIAALPTVNGHPTRPFVGVHGAVLNANTPNTDLAEEFIENYLFKPDNLAFYHADGDVGLSTNRALYEQMIKDPRMAATAENAKRGVMMPNVSKMGQFWSAMGTALSNIITGRAAPDKSLDMAAKRIVR